jgi:4a-hydroxytetrahydrobiopterin dehydratase
MDALSQKELEVVLERQPGWELKGGMLVREWKFRDFLEAMSFVYWVAEMAEEEGHHPDIDIRYNKIRLALVTHDAGGITYRDAGMAAKISARFAL